MRWSHGFVPLLALLVFLTSLPAVAGPEDARSGPDAERPVRAEGDFGRDGPECRTAVDGPQAVAHCHNPYPALYRVALHVECAHWWDLDVDGAAVEVRPAGTVRLAARCWSGIDAVWVTQHRV
ncbi:hypothetical protein [Streptomyces sp. NPDC002490]|uniref:hypothetical protein n=1 Tax=Streptomyces sp. NPDC002490 TaxID=3154416 RepID=UPI00331F43B2